MVYIILYFFIAGPDDKLRFFFMFPIDNIQACDIFHKRSG